MTFGVELMLYCYSSGETEGHSGAACRPLEGRLRAAVQSAQGEGPGKDMHEEDGGRRDVRFPASEPVLIGTSSKRRDVSIGYAGLRRWIETDPRPFLLLFGTGWGLPADMVGSMREDDCADQGTGGL